MTAHRLIAVAMVLLEAATGGFFFDRWVFFILVAAAAIAGAPGRWQLPESRTRDLRLTLLLLAGVVVYWRVIGVQDAAASAALAGGLGFAMAQFFLIAQVYELFVRRVHGISPLFVLFGAMATTCTGDVLASGRWQDVLTGVYVGAAMLFVALAVMFWLTGRAVRKADAGARPPWLLLTGTLAASLVFGAAVSFTLKTNQQALDTWFANLVTPRVDARTVGFPDRAFLHSIGHMKQQNADAVALRVVSDRSPGYLKGLTYDLYSDARWTVSVTPEVIQPQADPREDVSPGMNCFPLRSGAPAGGIHLNVWPEVDTTGAFFVPLNSIRLRAPFDSIMLDAAGNVASPDNTTRSPYAIEAIAEPLEIEQLTETERTRYTFLPTNLDPGIPQLAGAILSDADSVDEKVAAVTRYFRETYHYELGITVPAGVDPLAYFLLEKPPAHCEYFATGAAVLLRIAGVPCRYVTGFVTVERNSFGGYWVARNRDAHAWVEAYDESRGWFIVEATVAEGVPSEATVDGPNRIGELWDYAKFLVREIVAAYVVGGIRGLMDWIGGALVRLGSRLLAPIPVAVMALLAASMLWRFRPRRSATPVTSEPASRVELRRLLHAMDERLQRLGIERAPHETVLQFASRVPDSIADRAAAAHAAQWYRTYARLRFGAQPTCDEIGELREGLVEFDGRA